MKYNELQTILQNQLNTKITLANIANVLGITRQNMDYRVSSGKGDVQPAEIKLLEQAFNISLAQDVMIDYYPDVFGSCGNGVFELSQEKKQIIIPKSAFFTDFNPHKKYSMINAYGDSMMPFICDKDRLIVEHYNGEQIIDNRPYVFCFENQIFIKRLVKNITELVIKSDNKEYNPIVLSKNDMNNIIIIGQIVGLMRDLR